MLGYWGRPAPAGPTTGDLVERLDEANYAYLGRRDAMVKSADTALSSVTSRQRCQLIRAYVKRPRSPSARASRRAWWLR